MALYAPTPVRHYVYIHRKTSDRAVFYVGKGKGRRAWGRTGRNKWWLSVAEKHGCSVEILRDDLSEPCALALERAMICIIGKDALVNLVDGGGGISGWTHSAETKAKISAFNKGKKPTQRALDALAGHRGRFTPEHRRRMSAAAKARPRRPLPEEVRRKIAASHMGIRPSAETLRKMSAAKVGKAVGRASPTYDHTIRTFDHPEHGRFVGTRADFIAIHGLCDSCVSAVITGRRKSVKGWRKP